LCGLEKAGTGADISMAIMVNSRHLGRKKQPASHIAALTSIPICFKRSLTPVR
jgi:hypothetical protein